MSILAQRLKSITFELRASEKAFYAKIQELHGGTNRSSNISERSNNSD